MVKKYGFPLFKVALLSLALYFLALKLNKLELSALQFEIDTRSLTWHLLLFLALSIINLSLDAKAWQLIESMVNRISLGKALSHNLKCYGLAFITPLNSGELAGRYLVQKNPVHRKKALFLTFWTHAPKLFSKALVSLLILSYLAFEKTGDLSLGISGLFLFALVFFIYTQLQRIIALAHNKQLWNRPLKDYLLRDLPKTPLKLKALALNALRFLIFSGQLVVILDLINPELINPDLVLSIPLFYFLTAVIPTFAGLDFLIKGVLAMYFFGAFNDQALIFGLATTAVWLFNLAIPSLIGLASLSKAELNILKQRTKRS